MAITLADEQRFDWLRLIRSESVGPRTFRALIQRFGSAAAALEALPEVSRKAGRPVTPFTVAEAEREWRAAERLGVRFVALGEADYPAALQAIDTAPPLIAVRGDLAALRMPAVAIVGSRNASAVGMKFTERLALALSEAGYLVVSGLARGIDTAAHGASLAGGTAAVMAGGHERIYPPQNEPLLLRLIEKGCAISEMPMGWEARGRDFPRRNRIVSGMSLAVVVVEAARGSGSLITARFANEQGRDVFAVPGSPLDPRAAGTNDLIRQGATLCAEPAHVIDALQPLLGVSGNRGPILSDSGGDPVELPLWDELPLDDADEIPTAPAPIAFAAPNGATDRPGSQAGEGPAGQALSGRLFDLLGPTPLEVDDLVRLSGASARDVQLVLIDMELDGRVRRHAGQRVSRG